VIHTIGVAAGAPQWTFTSDLNRQGRCSSNEDGTPRTHNLSSSHTYLDYVWSVGVAMLSLKSANPLLMHL
jgi:hypothetical protein